MSSIRDVIYGVHRGSLAEQAKMNKLVTSLFNDAVDDDARWAKLQTLFPDIPDGARQRIRAQGLPQIGTSGHPNPDLCECEECFDYMLRTLQRFKTIHGRDPNRRT